VGSGWIRSFVFRARFNVALRGTSIRAAPRARRWPVHRSVWSGPDVLGVEPGALWRRTGSLLGKIDGRHWPASPAGDRPRRPKRFSAAIGMSRMILDWKEPLATC